MKDLVRPIGRIPLKAADNQPSLIHRVAPGREHLEAGRETLQMLAEPPRLHLSGLVQTRIDGRHVIYSLRDGHLGRLISEAISPADYLATGEASHG